MTGSPSPIFVLCAITLVGLVTGSVARWFDARLDVLLDRGFWAAIATSVEPETDVSWNPAFEIGAILLFALVAGRSESVQRMGAATGLSATLILCAWTDWRYRILPDLLVLPLLVAGLLLAIGCPLYVDAGQSLCGIFLGLGMTSLVRLLGRRLHGCLGVGDIKLLAALGAWLGPIAVAIIYLTSSMLMIVFLVCRRKEESRAWAFGPALSTVAVCYLLCFS